MGNDEIMNERSQPELEKNVGGTSLSENESIIQIINSLIQKLRAKEKLFPVLRKLYIIIISILVTLSFIVFILYLVPVLQEVTSGQKIKITNSRDLKQSDTYK